MRNLVIYRITEYLRQFPDFISTYDVTEDQLQSFSNADLLDLYTEIVEDMAAEDTDF